MAGIVVREAVEAVEAAAGDELRAGEEVAGGVVTDDRPGVMSEPQKRRHGEDCDEWDNHQIHPTNRGRPGLKQPKSRSLSPPRMQTGLLSSPGTERPSLSRRFARLQIILRLSRGFLQLGERP